MLRLLFVTLSLITAFTLSSCVEGEEELWINDDASGRLVAHYEIPAVALSQLGKPEDFLRAVKVIDEKEDEIAVQTMSFEVVGTKAIIHVEATFDDARELIAIADRNLEVVASETGAESAELEAIAGQIDFRMDGLTPAYDRVIAPGDLFPPLVARRPGMLGQSSFNYIMHLPAPAKQSNAHLTSADGKTLTWKFLLKDHFDQPMEMSLRMELPVPMWVWLVSGATLLGMAFGGWKLIQRRRSRKLAKEPGHHTSELLQKID